MTHRLISHSEVSAALECQAKHAFRYTGTLTGGDALRPKTTAPLLSSGRAWGAAVATYHAHVLETDAGPLSHHALDASLATDADDQRTHGLYLADDHQQLAGRLHQMLDHYIATADPLPVERLEGKLAVAIPSRAGRRRSNRYQFTGYVDAFHEDGHGTWIVEFKLRGQLTSLELIALSRQTRWYAWAFREVVGIEPVGVIVDERWNEVPKPARVNQGRGNDPQPAASHAKDQLTTPDLYVRACADTGEAVNEVTLAALAARRWQHRERVTFRPGELDEAGWQLVSAARLVQQLDSGELYPIRNPGRARCPGCPFRAICPTPDDVDLVDALHERVPPKRDREEQVAA